MSDKARRDWSYVWRCRSTFRMRDGDTDDIRWHHLLCENLWVGSSRNWSVYRGRPQHGTPRDSSCSLSMHPEGCTPWCSTNALVASSLAKMRKRWSSDKSRLPPTVEPMKKDGAPRLELSVILCGTCNGLPLTD